MVDDAEEKVHAWELGEKQSGVREELVEL